MESDAGLFGSKKKPSSAPAQTEVFGKKEPRKDSTTLESNVKAERRGNFPQCVPA